MNHMATIDGENTVTLVRDLPGPIERVWSFLTDPAQLSRWLSGGVVADRVGGEVRLEMGADGHVTVYDPPHTLEYTWSERYKDRGPILDSVVRWQLDQVADRVRLTLTHRLLSPDEAIRHAAGWHAFLDRFAAVADGTEPPEVMARMAQLLGEYGTRCSNLQSN